MENMADVLFSTTETTGLYKNQTRLHGKKTQIQMNEYFARLANHFNLCFVKSIIKCTDKVMPTL